MSDPRTAAVVAMFGRERALIVGNIGVVVGCRKRSLDEMYRLFGAFVSGSQQLWRVCRSGAPLLSPPGEARRRSFGQADRAAAVFFFICSVGGA